MPLVYFFFTALGPHPQRELTPMAHAQRASRSRVSP